jgi:hypothetical protein
MDGFSVFSLGPLLFGGEENRIGRQRKDLVKRGIISHEGSQDQSFPGLAQGSQIDLQKGGDSVVVIETQSISIRNGNQEKIKNNLEGGKVSQKPPCDETVIDPAEGPFNLSDPVWAKKLFDTHGPHLLASMVPLSFRQGNLSIETCISTQGKVEKRNVISRG